MTLYKPLAKVMQVEHVGRRIPMQGLLGLWKDGVESIGESTYLLSRYPSNANHDVQQVKGCSAGFDGTFYGTLSEVVTFENYWELECTFVPSTSTYCAFIGGANTTEGLIRIRTDNSIQLYIAGSAIYLSTSIVNVGVPNTVKFIKNGTSLTCILNGISRATTCSVGPFTVRFIGAHSSATDKFNGNMHSLKMKDGTKTVLDLAMMCKGSSVEYSQIAGLPYCTWSNGSDAVIVEHTDGFGFDPNVLGFGVDPIDSFRIPYSRSNDINYLPTLPISIVEPSPTLLYSDDFDTIASWAIEGDDDGKTIAVSADQAISGGNSLSLKSFFPRSALDIETSFGKRIEIQKTIPNDAITFFSDTWIAFSIFVPSGYGIDGSDSVGQHVVAQYHARPDNLNDADGSGNYDVYRLPPWAVLIDHGAEEWGCLLASSPDDFQRDSESTVSILNGFIEGVERTIQKGEWSTFFVRMNLDYTESGVFDLWLKDSTGFRQLVKYSGPLGYNDVSVGYVKLGIYYWTATWNAAIPSLTIYHDNFQVSHQPLLDIPVPSAFSAPLGADLKVISGDTYPDVVIQAPLGPKFQAIPEWTGEAEVDLSTFINDDQSRFGPDAGVIYDTAQDAAAIAKIDKYLGYYTGLMSFNFTQQFDIELNATNVMSNIITVPSVVGTRSFTVTGGTFQINSEGWGTTGDVVADDTIQLRGDASSENETPTNVVLTCTDDSAESTFTFTTVADAETAFNNLTEAQFNALTEEQFNALT